MLFLRWRIGRVGHWPPTLAVSTWSLRHEFKRGLTVFEFPSFVKKRFHVSHLEFVVNNLDSQEDSFFEELCTKVREAGMYTACLALDNDFSYSGQELEEEVMRASEFIRKAAILGAQLARINPGFVGPPDSPETAKNVVRGLRSLLPIAQRYRVHLALENHGLFGMAPV